MEMERWREIVIWASFLLCIFSDYHGQGTSHGSLSMIPRHWVFVGEDMDCFSEFSLVITARSCENTPNYDSWCAQPRACRSYPDSKGSPSFENCQKTCNICLSEDQCGDGYYGPECKPCVSRCQGGQCETARPGECQQTCPDGYHCFKCNKACPSKCVTCDRWSDNCTDCRDGLYGSDCTRRCSDHCEGEEKACAIETGECLYGCIPMWEGDRCDKTAKVCKNCNEHDCTRDGICQSGCKDNKTHGLKCEDKCSPNCRSKICSQGTGDCLKGCKPGFYGSSCSLNCSDNCDKKRCNGTTGRCKICVSGRYGDNCTTQCSSNCESSCYRKTGKCRACKVGWHGVTCTDPCTQCLNGCERDGTCNGGCHPGYYSSKCDKNCNLHCINSKCDQTTGDCTEGCQDTWYGKDCSNKCSSNCSQSLCTPDALGELECLDGCITGKKGKYCEEPCPDHCVHCTLDHCILCEKGYHGVSCEMPCPDNCEGGCQKTSGHCLSCKSEFYGDKCNQTCNDKCKNNECRQVDGVCTEGCVDGWKDLQCDVPCPSNCTACNDTSCSECKPGWYDLSNECDKQCSRFCLRGACDSSVECKHGCVQGFFGIKCNQTCLDVNCLKCDRNSGQCLECKPTWYGPTCNELCGNCLEGNCSRKSGECGQGCLPGYHGIRCDIICNTYCKMRDITHFMYCEQLSGKCLDVCTMGRYGDKCDKNCSGTCNAHVCNQTTGRCDYGCQGGKYGDVCGRNCSDKCGKEGDIQCDQSDGSCVVGCQTGWYGNYCKHACPGGCLDSQCHQDTGHCVICKRGVKGHICNTACPDHQYGFNCIDKCGNCKNNATCDRFYGNCSAGCADGFDGDLCVQRLTLAEPTKTGGDASLPIVLAVVAILLVAVLFVAGFLIYKRIRKVRPFADEYLTVHGSSLIEYRSIDENIALGRQNEHIESAHIYEEIEDADAYYNIASSHLTVKTTFLMNYIQHMKNEAGFRKQFKELTCGLMHKCEVAMLPVNQVKNRYTNIYPYDKSRVVLDTEDEDPYSDYINASYISSFIETNMFVASQGPIDASVNDFWRMIWQLNTSKIVMLADCKDAETVECTMYWPEFDTAPRVYGNIVVECTTEDVLVHYTIRTMKLCSLEKVRPRSSSGRVVKHFQFTSWPDNESVASMVEFYYKVINTPTHGQGPMVVHCSNGVGRTGVFLALVNLMEEAKGTGVVNPFVCVQKMRHERVDMVKTEEQYELLHITLIEAISAGDTTVSDDDIQSLYDDCKPILPVTDEVKLKEQFETLKPITPPFRLEEYQTAMLPDNISKNRFKDILASDYHRPYLTTPIYGRTDYINAVYLPGYKQKRAFILTQMPMQDTVIDFWRMMFKTSSTTIVMLNDDNDDQQTIGYYWPQNTTGRDMYGSYFVEVKDSEDHEVYRIITLNVINNSLHVDSDTYNASQRTIKLYQCNVWPEGQITPLSATLLLKVIQAVNVCQQESDQAPITVHCLDGVERSGLFCVLFVVLNSLKFQQDVSIPQTINKMRVCRPQLIQKFNQFAFLHLAVNEYLERFSEV